MHQLKNYLRYFVLIILILSFATGCQRIRSMAAVRYMERRLAEAEEYEAQKYVPDLLEEVRNIFNEVRNAYDGQNYEVAAERGAVGRERAQTLVETARRTKAEALLSRARDKRQRAELNMGQTIDAEIFNNILENFAAAESQYRDERYDRSIDNSQKVIDDTNRLLRNLADDANRRYSELERVEEQLIRLDAETYASSFLVGFQNMKETVKENFEEEHNYLLAIRNARRAMDMARETETETYRGISSEIIALAEQKLAEAREKDAEELAPVQFNASNELFAQNLRLYLNTEYEKVVMNRERFMSNLDNLLELTYERSAQREIDKLSDGIAALEHAGARRYLSSMMETAQDMLDESMSMFEDDDWEYAEDLAREGQLYLDRIHGEYRDITLVALNEALSQINKAEDDGAITFAFGALRMARDLYDQAAERLETLDYDQSIRLAQATADQAEVARQEALKNRAQQEVVLISRDIETKILQGIMDYSPEELEEAEIMLENMEAYILQQNYEQAVETGQLIKSKLSLGLQNVIRQTIDHMNEADKQITLAEEYKAREYFPDEMSEVYDLFERAQNHSDNDRFKEALETAKRARNKAYNLEQESTRLWTLDELKIADTKINDARNAFAHEFASDTFEEAVSLYFISKNQLKDEQLREALQSAFDAQKTAQEAKYFLVNKNKELISDAKHYQANRYYPRDYLNSLAHFERGSQLLEEYYYKQAYEFTSKSIDILEMIIYQTKNERVQKKITDLDARYSKLKDSYQYKFLPEEFSKIHKDFIDLQEIIDPQDFENATELIADNISNLDSVLEQQEAHVDQMIAQLQEKYQYFIEEERVPRYAYNLAQDAASHLRYLKVDISKDDYSSAYQTYTGLNSSLADMKRIVDEKNYFEKIYELIDDLQETNRQFATTLDLGPALLKTNIIETLEVKVGWRGVVGSITPDNYKLRAVRIHREFDRIDAPSHLEGIHKQTERVFENFSTSADYFEKLVLSNKMSRATVDNLIDNAFRFKQRTEAEMNLLQINIQKFRLSTPIRRSMFAYLTY